GEFRPNPWNGFYVLRGALHVVDDNGLAFQNCLARNTFAHLDAQFLYRFRGVPDGETDAQILRFLVEQQDGEDLVIDDFPDDLAHALEDRVQIEGAVQNISDLEQERLNALRRAQNWMDCAHS